MMQVFMRLTEMEKAMVMSERYWRSLTLADVLKMNGRNFVAIYDANDGIEGEPQYCGYADDIITCLMRDGDEFSNELNLEMEVFETKIRFGDDEIFRKPFFAIYVMIGGYDYEK